VKARAWLDPSRAPHPLLARSRCSPILRCRQEATVERRASTKAELRRRPRGLKSALLLQAISTPKQEWAARGWSGDEAAFAARVWPTLTLRIADSASRLAHAVLADDGAGSSAHVRAGDPAIAAPARPTELRRAPDNRVGGQARAAGAAVDQLAVPACSRGSDSGLIARSGDLAVAVATCGIVSGERQRVGATQAPPELGLVGRSEALDVRLLPLWFICSAG
jgi:hypothetical protein